LRKAAEAEHEVTVESHDGVKVTSKSRRQAEDEQETGEPTGEWIDELPPVVDAINEDVAENRHIDDSSGQILVSVVDPNAKNK
jgi:uncharacterized FlaG/YvyC family protein